jgi:anti-sigma factor RsiW
MVDCERFLAEYSAYRDGELSWEDREAFDEHLFECASCERYDRVVSRGADVLRDLPEIEVSEDFAARLQHRLYHVDEEEAWAGRRASARQALATLAVAACVAAAAWIPLARQGSGAPVLHLPAVAVQAPARTLAADPRHVEASTLTSQLKRLGVAVYELPYHDLIFRKDGPLGGSLASYEAAR